MTPDLFPQHWLTNTLFDDGFIAQKSSELAGKPLPYDLHAWLSDHFDVPNLAARNEAQLEEKFIAPLLARLGWAKAYQVGITVQGKFAKPDYCLLLNSEDENKLIAGKDHALITAICESKAWDKTLDTGKADRKDNPHHQLQDYLSTLRVRFGFLTNGRIWRVYDTDKITAKKTFIEFDLERLWSLKDAAEKAQGYLGARFDELRGVMQELDAMRDTTAAEVEQSKQLWKHSIAPKLNLLSRALSFICTRRAMLAEGDSKTCQALDKTPDLITQLFDENKSKTAALKQVEAYAARYHFFHYEVAFPEAFAHESKGFDIIVGNPPWDKTKFSDTDFFPQYHSNYRSLKNTDKAAVQKRLLESEHIAAAYQAAQRSMEVADDYYTAAFPLNKGAGDGNLFRLFVERNLGLLAPGGSHNYVLLSALMFEEGSTVLRGHIFTHCQMPFFYSFENRNGIFPDVDSRYKFALMQVINAKTNPPQSPFFKGGGAPAPEQNEHLEPPFEKGGQGGFEVIDTAFYVLDAAELNDPARHIPYPVATLKALSPQHWALMELRDSADLAIGRSRRMSEALTNDLVVVF